MMVLTHALVLVFKNRAKGRDQVLRAKSCSKSVAARPATIFGHLWDNRNRQQFSLVIDNQMEFEAIEPSHALPRLATSAKTRWRPMRLLWQRTKGLNQ